MIPLLYAILFCVPFVRAELQSLNDTCIQTLNSSSCSPSNTRTLWDILSSCGLTLFACTWTAIHPNIPSVNDGVVLITFYRLCLMFVAVFIPEFMTIWAIAQFFCAQKAAKQLNYAFGAQRAQPHSDHQATCQSEPAVTGTALGGILNSRRSSRTGWTLTHGFFAWMGGFVLYVHGEPRATLTPNELERFVRKGYVEMPVITEADIEDRSKGDGLYKCIAILQLAWFVVQLIARTAQGLPVTLLEIDTLGVVAMACIAYGFWWRKPKDIRRPYIVHWNSEATDPSLCASNLENNYYYSHTRRSLVRPLLFGFDDQKSGPSLISFVAGCFSGVVFGAVHCLGWNVFLRRTEQILWRVASIGATCSPLMTFFAFALPAFTGILMMTQDRYTCVLDPFISAFAKVFTKLGKLLYICSRLTMLVLVFMSLRSLPPGAYDTVAWIKHIPHINL
ncbi:hypothetical protein BDR05DRAFT_984127 [Suillus weaverae]|nr:hypothetical protein BDR05DRAFT_984127 [Suillus weaverae]